MSTNVLNIPNGSVLVPVQLSGGTGFVPVQIQSGGTGSVPVQIQSGGTGSIPGSSPEARLLEFKRRSPQVLGTVQIMVGVMLLLFGVMLCFFGDTLTVFSGVFAWAPLFYIIAGSLTVAADRSMNLCMIKGSMAMNIVAAVMSCAATILYGIDAGIGSMYFDSPLIYKSLSTGVSLVQCVFNLLVLIISICVSVFAGKAACCQQTLILQAVVMGNHLPEEDHPKAVGSRGDTPTPGGRNKTCTSTT